MRRSLPSSAVNPLSGRLPTTVTVGGREYAINTSHRTGIAFEELVQRHIADATKIALALELYYPECPPDIPEAIRQMLWFYRLGKDERELSSQRVYDYGYDFDNIYASFQQAYHVDLFDADLHWWRFRAMLLGLPEDTPFMKAVGYRQMRIPQGMPREQREFYAKMKRLHALPGTDTPKMTIEEVRRAKFGDLVDTVPGVRQEAR